MNRADLQELARTRQRESRVLLDAGEYAGAYYLAGYAIENGLKAVIAKQVQEHSFPDRKLAERAWQHDPKRLASAAGLEPALDEFRGTKREQYWAVVARWSPDSRYQSPTEADARDLMTAISDPADGVFKWIEERW